MIVMMIMCPSMYTVVSSQLRHTILMIVTVLRVRRFVHRRMITVLQHNFDDSDGDYVPSACASWYHHNYVTQIR